MPFATNPAHEAFPLLSAAQFASLSARGTRSSVRAATPDAPEQVVATHTAGRFLGELDMLSGQAVSLTARVSAGGVVHRIAPASFRRMMSERPRRLRRGRCPPRLDEAGGRRRR